MTMPSSWVDDLLDPRDHGAGAGGRHDRASAHPGRVDILTIVASRLIQLGHDAIAIFQNAFENRGDLLIYKEAGELTFSDVVDTIKHLGIKIKNFTLFGMLLEDKYPKLLDDGHMLLKAFDCDVEDDTPLKLRGDPGDQK